MAKATSETHERPFDPTDPTDWIEHGVGKLIGYTPHHYETTITREDGTSVTGEGSTPEGSQRDASEKYHRK